MFKVNFREELGLEHKIRGYIARVTEPKGVKTVKDGVTSYSLKTKVVGVPSNDIDEITEVEPGIYEVCDICKWFRDAKLYWNFYLVVVNEDGSITPVAEYLDNPYTLWVKPALKVVKAYFNGEELETIELTPQPKKRKEATKATEKDFSKYMSKPKKREEKKKSQPKEKPKELDKKSTRKKPSGRPQEGIELEYGQAKLMTFTGMVIGVYKILRHNKKYIEVETQKGVVRFSKENGKQVNAEKPRYANKIEWNLDK